MGTANATNGDEKVLFWALNGYGVTILDLLANGAAVLLGTAIMILNALVLDTMIRLKKHPEPANVIVCSLALADFMTGLCLFYQTSYNLANYQVYLECLIRFGFLNGLVVTSVLHLVCLTLDRYIKIISPYRYQQVCKVTFVCVVVVFLWCVGLVICFTPAMGWNRQTDNASGLYTVRSQADTPVCSFFGLMHPDYLRFMIGLFWVPFLIMGCLYLLIFKVAHRHAQVIAVQERSQPGARLTDRHSWKYTKTVLLVMGLYFLCWLPIGIILILFVLGDLRQKTLVEQGTVLLYASTSAYLNSFLNPIIYALKIRAVRARFRTFFCCRSRAVGDSWQRQACS